MKVQLLATTGSTSFELEILEMTTAMSMLMIRKALNTFCEDHELSIKSAVAADAARYRIKINSEEIPSITTLRSLLETWIEERALSV